MSTGVSDQRMRGQGSQANGPNKDQINDHEDFSSWRTQSIQNTYVSSPAVASTDHYLSSYYGPSFSYQLDHGAWSSNAAAAGSGEMPFLGSYGAPSQHQQAQHLHQQDSYGIDGMFGPSASSFSNFGGQPAFGGAYAMGSDYSNWDRKTAHYDDYYQTNRAAEHHAVYPPAATSAGRMEEPSTSSAVKQVEQGMQGLALETAKPVQPEVQSQQQQQQQPQQPKKLTWASIASQPAKPQLTTKKKSMVPPPMVTPRTPSLDIGTWENKNGAGGAAVAPTAGVYPTPAPVQQAPAPVVQPPTTSAPTVQQPVPAPTKPAVQSQPPSQQHQYAQQQQQHQLYQPPQQHQSNHHQQQQQQQHHHQQQHHQQPQQPSQQQQQQRPMRPTPPPVQPAAITPPKAAAPPAPVVVAAPVAAAAAANPVLEELHSKHIYNPKDFDLSAKNARFFVIKSYSEDDIHRSIKYEIWCSTEHGNKRLDAAFRERDGKGPIYLYFSVNGSGHFCGMAEMTSAVDMSSSLSVWSQDKWRGQFTVKWIYVKDVPNSALRHIRLENNENKPVTNSRDTQEVPVEKGRQVLKILHSYRHATSIFDDFSHYEKRQAEEDQRKTSVSSPGGHSNDYENERPAQRDYQRPERRDRDYDRMDSRDFRPRNDRNDRNDRNERHDRNDRLERNDRNERPSYQDYGRDGGYMRERDNRGGNRDGNRDGHRDGYGRPSDRDSQQQSYRGDRNMGGRGVRDTMSSRPRH